MNSSHTQSYRGVASALVLLLLLPGVSLAQTTKRSGRGKAQITKAAATPVAAPAQTPAAPEADTTQPVNPSAPSANDETAPPVVLPQAGGVPAGQQPAGSQQPTTSPEQTPTATQQLPRSKEQPTEQRVGVDLNNPLNLSIHDAVVLALNKNLAIAVDRVNVELAEYDLKSARGVYDLVYTQEVTYGSFSQPSANIFSGAGTRGSFSQKSLNYNADFRQLIPTGGSYNILWNNQRATTDSTATALNPNYTNNLTFNINQPVLRNFKIDANRRQIRIAKRRLDMSDVTFKQTAITTINQVQNAYWDLVFALQNEQIARDAVELAVISLEQNRKRVEAGDLAPIDIVSAEAQVETRKVAVIAAMQQVTFSENRLKALLSDNPNDSTFWTARVVPTTKVEFQPVGYSLNDAMTLALANRTELQMVRDQIALNEIDREYFRNQTKPQVDLIGSYGFRGLAGAPTSIATQPSRVSNQGQIDLINQLNQLALLNNLQGLVVPAPIITPETLTIGQRFIGGQGRALGNLFGLDFRSWQFGVSFSTPFRNRTAQANLGRSLARGRQLDLEQKQLVQNIQVQVRNALQAVESARQRIEAARAARINAETQLRGEEQRFRAGLTINFFVLQRQNELSQARAEELRALTDYNKAIADLQRELSITLESAGVQVQSPITLPADQRTSDPKKTNQP